MRTINRKSAEANRAEKRKEFTGKAQMPEILRESLNILASGSWNSFFCCCYLQK